MKVDSLAEWRGVFDIEGSSLWLKLGEVAAGEVDTLINVLRADLFYLQVIFLIVLLTLIYSGGVLFVG